jgi:hypothetical protein
MKRLLTLLSLCWCGAYAQWSNDPAVNTPVFTGPNAQFAPTGVSDGSRGAFVFWLHAQTGANGIFAQRMDASGNRVFPASGIQIVLKPTVGSVYKDAIPDGSGGAIITWSLTAVGDTGVRVQRVDGNGSLAWLHGGVIAQAAQSLCGKTFGRAEQAKCMRNV